MASPNFTASGNSRDRELGRSVSQDSSDSTANLLFPTDSSPFYHRNGEFFEDAYESDGNGLQRQRSLSMVIRQAGGPNSIDNFAQSWQRAAAFPEVAPRRTSFVITEPDDIDQDQLPRGGSFGPTESQSLLRRQLEAAGPLSDTAIVDDGRVLDEESNLPSERLHPTLGDDAFSRSSFGGYGTPYGTISSRVSGTTKRHAAQLHKAQQLRGPEALDKEIEPLRVKQVQREDGTKGAVVIGQSTLPQTVFNSVNVLIGVGLLSLPLGFKHAGWIIGMLLLLFSAATTAYTAKILARCLDVDHTLITYADLAYISFGPQARVVTSLLFCLELIGACVALIVLFADSLNDLIPGWGVVQWKIFCGIILMPMNFVPLRLLSISSILGIVCCTSIILIVAVDGFIKPHSPGSLLEPATTYLFPDNWKAIPISFGLIMSPWGGHSVFPNIYRDMRHPEKYGKGLWVTYSFTFLLDLSMAVIGWLMFGSSVKEEITSNILLGSGYPRALSICIVVFIAIIPVTKVPLSCRPIVGTIDVLFGVDLKPFADADSTNEALRATSRVIIRILTIVVMVAIAIIFPSFDRIMALVGSSLCFTICIILPVAFYLKIFGKEIPLGERILDWSLLIVSTTMAAVGTVWAFLPKDQIGQA